MYLIHGFIETIPINAVINTASSVLISKVFNVLFLYIFISSNTKDPLILGIANNKDIVIALDLSIFNNLHAVIHIPDLLTPGKIAID